MFSKIYTEACFVQCKFLPVEGVLIGVVRCECLPGYGGKWCQFEVNECESSPCLNGATCLDLPANYSCVCPPAYSGHRCQHRSYHRLRRLALAVKDVKLKTGHLYSAFSRELPCKALRMAPVNERSHSFTRHPHVYPRME